MLSYYSYLEQLIADRSRHIPSHEVYLTAPALIEFDSLSWLILSITLATSAVLVLSAINSQKFVTLVFLMAAFLACIALLTAVNNILIFFALWELAATILWAAAKSTLRAYNTVLGPLATSWTGSFGSIAMLVMAVLLVIQSGSLTMTELQTSSPAIVVALLLIAVSFKSIGLLTTVWFPGREHAFAAASALLGGLGGLVVGLYPFMKINRLILSSHFGWQDTVIWIALAAALLFALAALRERDLYRICSFIALVQLFILIASFAAGNQNAMQGALLGVLGYVAGVVGLFLAAGLVYQLTGTRLVGEEPALIRTQPTLAILFFIIAISFVGLPPLFGFTTKILLTLGLFQRNEAYSILWISVWLTSAISILRAFQLTFVNVPKSKVELVVGKKGVNPLIFVPLGLATVFLFSATLWQQDILLWLEPVATILSGES